MGHFSVQTPANLESRLGVPMKKRGPWFRKAPPLGIEILEDRVTPSAFFQLWAGTLTVGGSDNADWILLNRPPQNPNSLAVTVNNEARDFALFEIVRVHIDAKGGNDTVMVAHSVTIAVWITGGAGDDLLYGGSGNDIIDGGTGNDHIEGAAGNDVIQGGFGDDTILG